MHNYSCRASFTSLLYHANAVLHTALREPLLPALRLAPRRSAAAPGTPSGSSASSRSASPQPVCPLRRERRGGRTEPAPRRADRQPAAQGRCVRYRRSAGGILGVWDRLLSAELASPRGRPALRTPGRAKGSSPGRGQDDGLRCLAPFPLRARRQLRRGTARG